MTPIGQTRLSKTVMWMCIILQAGNIGLNFLSKVFYK